MSTHVPYLAIGEVHTFIWAAGKGAIPGGCWEGWGVRVGLGEERGEDIRAPQERGRGMQAQLLLTAAKCAQGLWQPPI